MDVDDVETPLGVEAPDHRGNQRPEAEHRLGGIDEEGERRPDAEDLEELLPRGRLVDRLLRGNEQPRSDHGHLVAAAAELRRLPVDMLGDPAQLRVVVLGDDCDAHTENR